MSGDDILSVIFLALICIVISGIVYKLAPNNANLIVPSFVLISIGLWITYDYMMQSRYSDKIKCIKRKAEQKVEQKVEQSLLSIVDEINSTNGIGNSDSAKANADTMGDTEPQNSVIPQPKKRRPDEFDLDIYSGEDDIRKLYTHMGADGDNQVCNRMKYMSVQPKLSKDIRASFNKYSWQPYVEAELRENEFREWWYMDQLDLHT
jgi:hypothetical protein